MILDSTNKITYLGDGTTTAFSYPFQITKADEVKLIKISPAGEEITITNNYYVETVNSIVYYPGYPPLEEQAQQNPPLPTGWKLIIYREVEITQEVALIEQYPFKVIEKMSDRSTMQIQQFRDRLNRSFSLSVAAADGIEMTLPAPKPLHSFRWDANGKKLELTEDPAIAIPVVMDLAEKAKQSAIAAEQSASEAEESAELASRYECGIKKKLFTVDDWMAAGDMYELMIPPVFENGMCVSIDRNTATGSTRVLEGVELHGRSVRLVTFEPYAGIAYFASFSVGKNNRYKKIFTTQDWQPSGIYQALTVDHIEHSLGIDAIVELIEKQINNNVYTNTTVQVDRQPNCSFVIYAQEAFNGQIILTGGSEQ